VTTLVTQGADSPHPCGIQRPEAVAIYPHEQGVTSVAWSPGTPNHFASSSLDGTVSVCRADSSTILHVHAIHGAPVLDVAWNEEAEFEGTLASLSADCVNSRRGGVRDGKGSCRCVMKVTACPWMSRLTPAPPYLSSLAAKCVPVRKVAASL
jgi:WD40 repeat protein